MLTNITMLIIKIKVAYTFCKSSLEGSAEIYFYIDKKVQSDLV